jgi:hypothetical protein
MTPLFPRPQEIVFETCFLRSGEILPLCCGVLPGHSAMFAMPERRRWDTCVFRQRSIGHGLVGVVEPGERRRWRISGRSHAGRSSIRSESCNTMLEGRGGREGGCGNARFPFHEILPKPYFWTTSSGVGVVNFIDQ